MGKKTNNTTTKEIAPAKRAAKPPIKKNTAAEPAVIVQAPVAKAVPSRPTAVKAAPPKPARKPAAPKGPAYTNEDVALRAYFIAEKRNAAGWGGDSHQDWIEAERQLAAEAAGTRKTKPKAKKV